MPLRECLETTTNREYDAWNKWLDDQWEEPSKTDLYIMQLTLQVASIMSKTKLKLHDFKLKFGSSKPKEQTPKDIAASKSRWKGMLGMLPKKKTQEYADKSQGELGKNK